MLLPELELCCIASFSSVAKVMLQIYKGQCYIALCAGAHIVASAHKYNFCNTTISVIHIQISISAMLS